MKYVESHYRTINDKNHRAIAGLSMGGFHSLYISANNPDLFGYVGLFSAAINRQAKGENTYIYEKSGSKNWQNSSPMLLNFILSESEIQIFCSRIT